MKRHRRTGFGLHLCLLPCFILVFVSLNTFLGLLPTLRLPLCHDDQCQGHGDWIWLAKDKRKAPRVNTSQASKASSRKGVRSLTGVCSCSWTFRVLSQKKRQRPEMKYLFQAKLEKLGQKQRRINLSIIVLHYDVYLPLLVEQTCVHKQRSIWKPHVAFCEKLYPFI